MARAMPGGDENAARDVGEFVAGVDSLRGDGLALVIRHTGKDGSAERRVWGAPGGGRPDGEAEAPTGLELQVECDYLRDAEEWSPLELKAVPTLESLALEMPPRSRPQVRDDLDVRVLAAVRTHGPCSQRTVEGNVDRRNQEVREALRRLERANVVSQSEDGWQVRPNPRTHPGRTAPGRPRRGVSRRGTLSEGETPRDAPRRQSRPEVWTRPWRGRGRGMQNKRAARPGGDEGGIER